MPAVVEAMSEPLIHVEEPQAGSLLESTAIPPPDAPKPLVEKAKVPRAELSAMLMQFTPGQVVPPIGSAIVPVTSTGSAPPMRHDPRTTLE